MSFSQAVVKAALLLAVAMSAAAAQAIPRPVTIMDGIELTEIGEPWDDMLGRKPAHFSPDGRQFVVVTHRGDIDSNSNEYFLLLFSMLSSTSFSSPRSILTIRSASNEPGMANLRWIDDDTIFMRATLGDAPPQVFSLRVSTGELRQVTDQSSSVSAYTVTSDSRVLLYVVRPKSAEFWNEKTLHDGLVVSNQYLGDLLAGHTWTGDDAGVLNPLQVFIKDAGGKPSKIDVQHYGPIADGLSISPDGGYGVIRAWISKDKVQARWSAFKAAMGPGVAPAIYLLVDRTTLSIKPLFDAPISEFARPNLVWTSPTTVVVANTYLPIRETPNGNPEQHFTVEVDVLTGAIRKIATGIHELAGWDAHSMKLRLEVSHEFLTLSDISAAKKGATLVFRKRDSVWHKTRADPAPQRERPEVFVEQGINLPPCLVARDTHTGQKTLLLDPNPQLAKLRLAKVQEITWRTPDGAEVTAGLFIPHDYAVGKPYPLVIQTHGWFPNRFSLDGLSSAGYAAQALAAKGFIVAQLPDMPQWEGSPTEGPRYMALHESAVETLVKRGLIDTRRMGILGWSRTGYHVRYTLAFSHVKFAAAVIADGMDASYGQYLSNLNLGKEAVDVYEAVNGGNPFSGGLRAWLERASGFNLEHVQTPTRLLTFTTPVLLNNWEWFVGLRYRGTPVELVWLRDAAHAPVRPSERLVAQQGNVDWFDFWLNGREDPDEAKTAQYVRWRELRSGWTSTTENRGVILKETP